MSLMCNPQADPLSGLAHFNYTGKGVKVYVQSSMQRVNEFAFGVRLDASTFINGLRGMAPDATMILIDDNLNGYEHSSSPSVILTNDSHMLFNMKDNPNVVIITLTQTGSTLQHQPIMVVCLLGTYLQQYRVRYGVCSATAHA
jgi:hypothetical protein